jgi:hypothetical protein
VTYDLEIKQGGYVFELDQPLHVNVDEGRVRGQVKRPIEFAIPKFDELYGAYVTPDGGAVQVRGDQLIDVPLPIPDGGVPLPFEGAGHAAPANPQAQPIPVPYDPKAPPNPRAKPPVFFGQ